MNEKIKIKFERVSEEFEDIPKYATSGSSGLDLSAAIRDELIIQPGSLALIPTNLRVAVPSGFEFQIRPRSGLALKNSIGVLNSPGTIDSDYRGEIAVILFNFGQTEFRVTKGMRIAQMILSRTYSAELEESRLDQTERQSGGFGHSGI